MINENIEDLLREVCQKPFKDRDFFIAMDKKFEGLLKKERDANVLVGLAIANLVLGNRYKSISIVKNIWNLGQDLNDVAYILYLDVLVNLGMFDMAKIMLEEKIAYSFENTFIFSRVLMKLAVLTFDFDLLKKSLISVEAENLKKVVNEFIIACEEAKIIQEIQKVLDVICVGLLDYVYALDFSFSVKKVHIKVYLGKEIPNKKGFGENIDWGVFSQEALDFIDFSFEDYNEYTGSYF